jgi:hypothetical protein
MTPMGPSPIMNPLDLEPRATRGAYTCTGEGCTFESYSAADVVIHLEANDTHMVCVEWTWQE